VKPDEESLRLRLQVADGFADLGWTVPADRRESVMKFLPDQFKLNKDGHIQKKTPAQ
jgi:hypothetical protein